MLVIPAADLNGLISEIAGRSRSVVDHNGKPVVLPTINESQLRAAALAALMVATGEMIWPGDKAIDLRQNEPDQFLKVVR